MLFLNLMASFVSVMGHSGGDESMAHSSQILDCEMHQFVFLKTGVLNLY